MLVIKVQHRIIGSFLDKCKVIGPTTLLAKLMSFSRTRKRSPSRKYNFLVALSMWVKDYNYPKNVCSIYRYACFVTSVDDQKPNVT